MSGVQRKLLERIAGENRRGISPRIYPVDHIQLKCLLRSGLVTYLGGFASLTAAGWAEVAS